MEHPRPRRAKPTTPIGDMLSWERQLTHNKDFDKALRELMSVIERGRSVVDSASHPAVNWDAQLRTFALLAVTHARFLGVQARDVWDTGKTPKALAGFAQRLRAIAVEIERVNRSPFFHTPDLTLPRELRTHAEDIERGMAFAKQLMRGQRGHSRWVFQLSGLVKRVTGHWHDAKVSRLLNAAANALQVSFQVDTSALAQARYRRRPST